MDTDPLCNSTGKSSSSSGTRKQRRPFHHLDLRFAPPSSSSSVSGTSLEQAQVNRDDLLTQRRIKLHQRFIQVQRTVQQVKARREKQALMFLQSLENADRNRIDRLEARRAMNKQLVDRAKSIAHQHRSQTKAERERRRIELERRLEASEIRRLNYLGLPKSTMASRMNQEEDDELVPCSSSTASLSPNKHRRHTSPSSSSSSLATLLHSFHHLGLPIISQQDTWLGFHALGRLIRQQEVITITGKVLNLALDHQHQHQHHHHHQHHHCHYQQEKRRNNNKPRVLLSAYMMIMCPHDILQSPESPDEIILLEAAKDLLQKFETWLDHPQRRQKRIAFGDSWTTFNSLFDQWKSKDRDQLVASMVGYYLELLSVQHTIHPIDQEEQEHVQGGGDDDDDGESQEVSDMLSQQMNQLKVRIGKLGGEAAIQSLEDQVATMSLRFQQQPKKKKKNKEKQQQQQEVHSAESMEKIHRLMNALPQNPVLTNAQLAHELILDPDFQLQAHQPNLDEEDLETRVRAMALRAYFDTLSQEIQEGQYQITLLPLLEDIRKKLLSMVEKGKPAYQMIGQVMDMTLIEQQMEQQTFNASRMISTILTCQRQLCAPSRDAALDKIQARGDDPGWQLEHIMGLLDDMHLDLANFRLRSLRPYLAPMAVEYETLQFCEDYDLDPPSPLYHGNGSNSKGKNSNSITIKDRLPHLYHWMGVALERWQRMAADRNPDHVHPSRNNHHSSPKELFYDGILDWIINGNLQQGSPETLKLDLHRLARFHATAQQITTVASLVMVAKSVGKVTSATCLATLSQSLFTLLSSHRPAAVTSSSQQHITAELLRVTTSPSPQQSPVAELMASMVQRILSHTDTVYALLGRRVATVLKHQLTSHQFVSDAVLASSSLEHVKAPLEQLATQVNAFGHHHLKVHLPWYAACLTHLQQKEQ